MLEDQHPRREFPKGRGLKISILAILPRQASDQAVNKEIRGKRRTSRDSNAIKTAKGWAAGLNSGGVPSANHFIIIRTCDSQKRGCGAVG
jgi:hypothetical protein